MAAANVAMARTVTETIPAEPALQMRLQMPHPPRKGAQIGANRMKNRLRMDPSRALEPSRKKIATIEAQRVMSVFEETIQRSEIVTLLPFIMENLDRFRIGLGAELSAHLEQHRVIEASYNEIKAQLDKQLKKRSAKSVSTAKSPEPGEEVDEYGETQELAAEDDAHSVGSKSDGRQSRASSTSSARSTYSIDSQTERTMRNLTLVAQQLSSSTKSVLRGFALNPQAFNAIKTEYSKRSEIGQDFVQNMNELREILMNKLLTTPEEEKERMDYLDMISDRERKNAELIRKLEEDLANDEAEKEEEIKKKNDVIRRLQADLHHFEKFSEENIRRVKAEAEKQEAADLKNSEGKKQKLQQEAAQLKTQLQNLVSEHRENEQELRLKKFKIETEVENWIQKYDQDMGERQDEYEEIDAVYTEEKKQLHELEERFKTLEAEYQQIMEERRLARERREAAEREMALMVKAATTVQAFWRSYKVRKALKARKKKKGGKGKKK